MEAIDYRSLLRSDVAPLGGVPIDGLYQQGDGAQFRSFGSGGTLVSEVVRLTDNALLLAGDYSPQGASAHRQLVSDDDWIHMQFRYSAGGFELMSDGDQIDLPPRTCIVAQYREGIEIVRELSESERWRHVCVFATRQGLSELLDVSPTSLGSTAFGRMLADPEAYCTHTLPLTASMISPGHDVIACAYNGVNRRAFMRAKSIELVSSVLAAFEQRREAETGAASIFSPVVQRNVLAAQELMASNLSARLTLSQIARRVGMSRTALATSFKAMSGVTVQEYWRNLRLDHARHALMTSDISVTQVAFDIGYSEVSSFDKAFQMRFDCLPRNFKRSANRSHSTALRIPEPSR